MKYYLNSQKDPFTLNVSNKQLLDVKAINAEFESRAHQNLSHLILSKNLLVTLELYNKTLVSLNASHNFLLKVVLSISSLHELNLEFNCLEQIPNLRTMKKLQVLKLSNNYITTLNEKALPKNLEDLNLSHNLLDIMLEVENAPENFCNKFGRFKSLKSLELYDNPFELKFPEYAILLRHYCPVSIDIKNPASKATPDRKNTYTKIQDGVQPHLRTMIRRLELAKKYPSSCADEINNVLGLIDAARDNPMTFENSLEGANASEFFENLDIIHSGQHKFRKELYTILAKLIYLKQLREKATETLKGYMRSSQESQEMAEFVLERVIVRELQKYRGEEFPIDVVSSLCAIAEVCTISGILKRIVRPFSSHLHMFKDQALNPRKALNTAKNIDYILGILAAGFKDNMENVKLVMEISKVHEEDSEEEDQIVQPSDFVETIKHFLSQENLAEAPSSLGSKRYDYLLQIITHCSTQLKEAGRLFFDMTFETFVGYLKISCVMYNDVQKDSSADKERAKTICRRFSSELVCCARMIDSPLIDIMKIIGDEFMLTSVRNILSILTRPSIDPFVLSALCELLLSLFKQNKVNDNDKLMLQLVEDAGEITSLLGFLGKDKWDKLCKQSQKYLSVPETTVPLIQQVKHWFLYDVVISIVKIISFFCSESRKSLSPSAAVVEKVNESLDANNREDILFDILSMNSLDVKLSVVDCLNNVPLDQISDDEMQRIVTIISTFKARTGQGIIVLSKLLWYISKLVKDQSIKVGKYFRRYFGKRLVKFVISTLLDTNLISSEKKEKEYQEFLVLSCIHFLQCASMTPKLEAHISTYSAPFCSIIKDDEKIQEGKLSSITLEVERTGMGRSSANILTLFTTATVLNPHSYTCLRVLQTLGKILSGSNFYDPPYIFPEELNNDSSKNPIELIKEDLKERAVKRPRQEEETWPEPEVAAIKVPQDPKKIAILEENIVAFTDSYMIDILLNFFLGTSANSTQPEMAKYIENFSKDKFPSTSLMLSLKETVNQIKDKFKNKEEKKATIEEVKMAAESAKFLAEECAIQALEKESLKYTGTFHDAIVSRGLSVNIFERQIIDDSKNAEVVMKDQPEPKPYESRYNRALIVSAIMRCIYNAYIYSPECRSSILKQLRSKKTLMNLTQLCFSTGWIKANVGIKYLKICKFILQLTKDEIKVDITRVVLNQIVGAALCDMMNLMNIRLKSERSHRFTANERDLILELASFGPFLIREIQYLDYLSLDRMVKEPSDPLRPAEKNQPERDKDFEIHFIVMPEARTHGEYKMVPQHQCAAHTVKSLFSPELVGAFISFVHYINRECARLLVRITDPQAGGLLLKMREKLTSAEQFIASYMTMCSESKYAVLESLVNSMATPTQTLREVHLQEILTFWRKDFIAQSLVSVPPYQ